PCHHQQLHSFPTRRSSDLADIRVAGGNFITAQPMGGIHGVDLLHTGSVRKVDVVAIKNRLDHNEVVLLSPLGYSPTGEVFNLTLDRKSTRLNSSHVKISYA